MRPTKGPEENVSGLEPPYQNRQEQQIGRLLDRYGIPFFYQSPMLAMKGDKHEVYYPSFALPQYGMSVIDYMQNPGDIANRIALYRYNQIPATVIGPKDLDKPNWQQTLYQKLHQEVLKIPDYSLDNLLKLGTMNVERPNYQIQHR